MAKEEFAVSRPAPVILPPLRATVDRVWLLEPRSSVPAVLMERLPEVARRLLPSSRSVPASIMVPPVFDWVVLSVTVFEPSLINVPVPGALFEKVKASERFSASVPLLVMFPVMLPVVPPLPSCSVPLWICVAPVKEVWSAATMSEPLPAWTSEPFPDNSPRTELPEVL